MGDMSRKMRTVEVVNFGEHRWNGDPKHAARIERARVLFSDENNVKEVLKFCYVKNGRHARTHLTISQEEFVSLFQSAIEQHVFSPETLKRLSKVLSRRP
jgi:hypothetical protein